MTGNVLCPGVTSHSPCTDIKGACGAPTDAVGSAADGRLVGACDRRPREPERAGTRLILTYNAQTPTGYPK